MEASCILQGSDHVDDRGRVFVRGASRVEGEGFDPCPTTTQLVGDSQLENICSGNAADNSNHVAKCAYNFTFGSQ